MVKATSLKQPEDYQTVNNIKSVSRLAGPKRTPIPVEESVFAIRGLRTLVF